jgi:hypothetical protein
LFNTVNLNTMKTNLLFKRILPNLTKAELTRGSARMKISFILFLLSFVFFTVNAQVPQGLTYQALAGDAGGNPIRNASLQVKISILSDTTLPVTVWEELHSTVKTNAHGIFSLIVGSGVRQPASAVTLFSDISWSAKPLFVKTQIYYQGVWKSMGSAKIWTVPYAMVAGSVSGKVSKFGVTGTTTSPDSALFEVKNKNGQTVFAVYSEGVRMYVDDGINVKGAKGGFAIGGFGSAKAASQEYLRITSDSVRIYVDETAAKGSKGGFSIGGFNAAKGTVNPFMFLTPQNYFIGHNSGQVIGTGLYNSTLGFESGKSLTTGSNNLLFGYQSGNNNTIGSSNVFMGNAAGFTNTSGSNDIFIGYQSGFSNTIGSSNVFIGNSAGYSNTSGTYNIILGRSAGSANTSGWGNIILGDYAGSTNSTGYKNVFIGDLAGIGNTVGYQNVFLGANSGLSNSTGFNNVFIGSETGRLNTTGAYNTFMGFESGYTNNANYNSFIGYRAGRSNTTGTNNSFMGYDAGFSNTTGSSNVFIGNTAGRLNTTGGNNVFLGDLTGFSNTGGTYNAFVGSEAGKGNTTGTYNTFFGYQAGFSSGGSSYSTSIGYKAGYALSNWQGGTYVGFEAGLKSTGRQNVFVGADAGQAFSTGADNVAVGGGAGSSNDYPTVVEATGSRNAFLGYYAGYKSAGATDNVLVGAQDPFGLTHITGSYNVYLGVDAGNLSSAASRNVFIGYQAGFNETGSDKLYIHNNSTATPLIWGDFSAKRLRFNGNTSINSYPNQYYALQINLDGIDDTYGLVVWGSSYGSSAWTFSDARLKKNILPLSNALNSVLSLNGVNFDWKTDENPGMGLASARQIGLIAQDVEKILPELVSDGPNGFKTVDYSKITPVLIEAIKEQQRQIQDQKARIEKLEKLVEALVSGK